MAPQFLAGIRRCHTCADFLEKGPTVYLSKDSEKEEDLLAAIVEDAFPTPKKIVAKGSRVSEDVQPPRTCRFCRGVCSKVDGKWYCNACHRNQEVLPAIKVSVPIEKEGSAFAPLELPLPSKSTGTREPQKVRIEVVEKKEVPSVAEKYCIKCMEPLKLGENWTETYKNTSKYVCLPCHRKACAERHRAKKGEKTADLPEVVHTPPEHFCHKCKKPVTSLDVYPSLWRVGNYKCKKCVEAGRGSGKKKGAEPLIIPEYVIREVPATVPRMAVLERVVPVPRKKELEVELL